MLRIFRNLLIPTLLLTAVATAEAGFVVSKSPNTRIGGATSKLVRPEAVAFTASGDLMAVANSAGHAITIYKKKDGTATEYHNAPCSIIQTKEFLNYVHDISFSPDEKNLVAASREGHTLTLFERNTAYPYVFGPEPFWTFWGKDSGLGFPASVAFDPSGDYLAVCNRANGRGISVYKKLPSSPGLFDPKPVQVITEEQLAQEGLAACHGLAFSPDGKHLAVTHKRFHKNSKAQGVSGLALFNWSPAAIEPLNPTPALFLAYPCACLHSLAFHPSGILLAVTNEVEDVTIYELEKSPLSLTRIASIPIDRKGNKEGPKGVGFTADGKKIAVTTASDEVLFFNMSL